MLELLSTNGTRNTFMNKYKTKFTSVCPVNHKKITYELEIRHTDKILVEDILETISKLLIGYHENIADELFKKFGGEQTLIANHHGVFIETERKL
jgi:hypothetical protein